MDREGGSNGGSCHYAVLGIRRDASFSDIRTAYRMLAMTSGRGIRGSPESRNAGFSKSKKLTRDFCDFMQEMITTMHSVKDGGDSFEDLQRMFVEMVGGDGAGFDRNEDPTDKKRARVNASKGNARKIIHSIKSSPFP